MRQIAFIFRTSLLAAGAVLGFAWNALAVPVYLTPESLFPSGHYNREWLKERTHVRSHQRWLRVRAANGASGWVPEDFLLTKLLLSSHARTQSLVQMRVEPKGDGRRVATLGAGQRVRLLGRTGRWFETQIDGTTLTGFLTAEELRPDLDAPALAYAKERTEIVTGTRTKSETLASIQAGERIEIARPPAVHENWNDHWVLVRKRGRTGYVRRAHLILREDLPMNAALSLRNGLPLRRESVPFAELSGRASYLETLKILDVRSEEWGRVHVRGDGEIWWPMNERYKEGGLSAPRPTKISTAQLFQRKIFDMAAAQGPNPLQLASANGVFLSKNGREWVRIDQFRDQNHPLAITANRRIFIGPYVSDDGGQTFREYIRWDNLVHSLRSRWDLRAHNVRILDVRPIDTTGEIKNTRIELALDIGLQDKIRVMSRDNGQTWTAHGSTF